MLYSEQLRRIPYNLYSLNSKVLRRRKVSLKAKKVLYAYKKIISTSHKFWFSKTKKSIYFWRVAFTSWFIKIYMIRFVFYDRQNEKFVFKNYGLNKKIYKNKFHSLLNACKHKLLIENYDSWWKGLIYRYFNWKIGRHRRGILRWRIFGPKKYYSKKFFIMNFKSVYRPRIKPLSQEDIDHFHKCANKIYFNLPPKFIKKAWDSCHFVLKNWLEILGLRIYIVLLNANFVMSKYYLLHFIKRNGVLLNNRVVYIANSIIKPWDFVTLEDIFRHLIFYEMFKNVQPYKKIWWNWRLLGTYLSEKKKLLLFYENVDQELDIHTKRLSIISYVKRWKTKVQFWKYQKSKNIRVNYSKYLEVNYRLLYILVITFPNNDDLNNKLWPESMKTRWK